MVSFEYLQRGCQGLSGIEVDDWYIDIMTAKLVDPKRRTQFQVVVLPNLFEGDIKQTRTAEFQGVWGTAGRCKYR